MTVLSIPLILREYPLDCLGLPYHLVAALKRDGYVVLGDLQGLTTTQLTGLPRRAVSGGSELAVAIREVLSLDLRQLPKLSRQRPDGQARAPALSVHMIGRILAARSLEAEVGALLHGLSSRDAAMIAELWSHKRGHRPTLEEVASRHGITRERVRQILARREKLLSDSGLKLPIGTLIVDLLDASGGALTTPALLGVCRDAGLDADRVSLASLPSLAKLHLLKSVLWSREHQLWLTDEGVRAWSVDGSQGERTKILRQQVRRQLAATGAVPIKRLEAVSPFGLAHATWLTLRRQARVLIVGDYAVPVPVSGSILTRIVAKLLAIAPSLSLQEIHAGLARSPRLRQPSLPVVATVLANHSAFTVAAERVSSSVPLSRAATLSPAERTTVAFFEEAGGLMLWSEVTDRLTAAGYSLALVGVLLSGPLFTRQAFAVYSLRGKPVNQTLLRQKRREWLNARAEDVVEAAWHGPDRLVAQFRLTRFTLQGIFPKPSELKVARVNWEGRFPDGRQSEIRVRGGLMWPLGRWLARVAAVAGDVVVATFFVVEGRVEFDHIPAAPEGYQ